MWNKLVYHLSMRHNHTYKTKTVSSSIKYTRSIQYVRCCLSQYIFTMILWCRLKIIIRFRCKMKIKICNMTDINQTTILECRNNYFHYRLIWWVFSGLITNCKNVHPQFPSVHGELLQISCLFDQQSNTQRYSSSLSVRIQLRK